LVEDAEATSQTERLVVSPQYTVGYRVERSRFDSAGHGGIRHMAHPTDEFCCGSSAKGDQEDSLGSDTFVE
jgi:hypothetical protein